MVYYSFFFFFISFNYLFHHFSLKVNIGMISIKYPSVRCLERKIQNLFFSKKH